MVLFDIGNVLFCDPWETLLLTPGKGLADMRGWDRQFVSTAARRLWEKFSVAEYEEDEYWQDLGSVIGEKITRDQVEEAETRLLHRNPSADLMLKTAQDAENRIGIISNNTSFWFAKQWNWLGLGDYIDPDLVFVSHTLGVSKSTPGTGLFECAARVVRPRDSVVVEDRQENVRRAAEVGFRTYRYSLSEATPLPTFS
ncbi:hypothetical protein DMA15_11450 [Streptomyces sp. WAC 01529]|uniref:hypothetical protein n=1 Tax=Streptomyces sp. WAC 01529 TaxID=2203205 RepID=UPI000F713CE5|nr:hypothetical protein [Streptomyces sp. WAC 01529]AZM53132.1 hypothetical protein DMA15_11450 [Streptomyces sp. WAC 01529]